MYMVMAMVMVFNATFNNFSAISLRSVLLVEGRQNRKNTRSKPPEQTGYQTTQSKPEYPQTGYPEKTTDSQITYTFYHIMLYRLSGIRTYNVSGDRY